MLDEKILKIVEKAIQGDNEAFVEICRLKGKDILYISAHIMGNMSDGEDAAQEILLYMHKHIQDIKEAKAFHAWLFQVTRSICINMKKKYKRKKLLFHEKPRDTETEEVRMDFLPYDFYEDSSKRDAVLEIVSNLPQTCKLCVLFFYYENMSYEEISIALNISKKDVDNNLMKAKKLIRRKLNKETDTKNFFSNIYTISPLSVPVLAQILQYEADSLICKEILEHLVEIGKTAVVGTAAGSVLGTGSAATGSGAGISSGTAGITAKVTLGIIVTAGAAALGANIIKGNEEKIPEQPVTIIEAETDNVEEIEPEITHTPISTPLSEEELEIHTLEDMIGAKESEMLLEYAGCEEISEPELKEFLNEIDLEAEESYGEEDMSIIYTLYLLDKQDKRLMVIVRYTPADETGKLAYVFWTQDIYIPRTYDIAICFEEWREE